MISIIIITKNEEKLLPKLLKSIKKQNYKDYEIILSDAHSTDRTRKIAKSFGCKIVNGGLPSVGRNAGARVAKGEVFVFLDADVQLPRGFLKDNIKELKIRKIDVATTLIIPLSKNVLDKLIYFVFDSYGKLTQFFSAHASGNCIICTRKIFKKVHGFDEAIKMAEDMEFVNRCLKAGGKFRILRSKPVYSDPRRWKKDGRVRTSIRYMYGEFHRNFLGEMKDSPWKYELHGGVSISKSKNSCV